MADEAMVDEFETPDAPAADDPAMGLTNGIVMFTTFLLVLAIILMMVAMKKWFAAGMLA
jgi:hypothetical protein